MLGVGPDLHPATLEEGPKRSPPLLQRTPEGLSETLGVVKDHAAQLLGIGGTKGRFKTGVEGGALCP